MTEVVLGCDSNSNDESVMNTVYEGLTQKGYKVKKLEIGPTPFSQIAYTAEAKGKVGVYLMADSLFSFADGTHDLYQKDVFVIRGGVGGGINSQQDFETKPLSADPDCNSACDEWVGLTYPQMNQKANGKCIAVYGGTTPEEALQAALQGLEGIAPTGGSTTQTTGGGAVLIPDKTFYGLIKQIIGAVDGVFIIANNMAYLLSFQQLFQYRDEYEDYILELKPSEIITDSVIKRWATEGLYNAVEVTYSEGIVKIQHDALVEIYGENVFYYDFPEDDEETAKAKADALLSAHVRDYSLDLQLNCIYNPNINVGSWIKIPKTLTKILGPTSKASQEAINTKKEEPKKYKGAKITNLNEILQKADDKTKTIQKITTDDGEKYEVEIEKKKYEIYFVQAYKLKWTPEQAPIMSLHLKYGPDTPEDPINATIATGGVQTTGGTAGGAGQWGNDCFTICDICIQNCDKILPYGGGRRTDAEEYIKQHQPESSYLAGRARQDSTYAKEVSGKSPQEAYTLFRSKFDYACYGDSCDASYPCCEDLWTKATAANCGDSTRMLKALMDATGTPCYGIHVDGHYFNAVQVGGTWHTLDGTRGPENSSCNFPDSGNYGAGSNACGSGWCQ